MADITEFELAGSELEATVNNIDGWVCPIEVIAECDEDGIRLLETWVILNPELSIKLAVKPSMFEGSELVDVLWKHAEEYVEEVNAEILLP